MIYLDTSVALAQLLGEDRRPPVTLWREPLISSRLLEYELWNRVFARKVPARAHDEVNALLEQVSLVELSPAVLGRALRPFPASVRTLDALHLATLDYLQGNDRRIRLATYDERMERTADLMKIEVLDLG
ncbi:MAG: PIN domain-containing protein [Alphaproteobacteria bacterium]